MALKIVPIKQSRDKVCLVPAKWVLFLALQTAASFQNSKSLLEFMIFEAMLFSITLLILAHALPIA